MPLGYSRAVFTPASFRSAPTNFRHKCTSLFASVNAATALGRAPRRSWPQEEVVLVRLSENSVAAHLFATPRIIILPIMT